MCLHIHISELCLPLVAYASAENIWSQISIKKIQKSKGKHWGKLHFYMEIMFNNCCYLLYTSKLYFARWMLNFYLKNMHMQISTNTFNYPAANILCSQAKMLSKMQVAKFGLGTAYEDSSPACRCLPGFCASPSAVSQHAVMCFRRQNIEIKPLGKKTVFWYVCCQWGWDHNLNSYLVNTQPVTSSPNINREIIKPPHSMDMINWITAVNF